MGRCCEARPEPQAQPPQQQQQGALGGEEDVSPEIAALSVSLLALLQAGRLREALPTIQQLQTCIDRQLVLARQQT